jgi:hypothetical protein
VWRSLPLKPEALLPVEILEALANSGCEVFETDMMIHH